MRANTRPDFLLVALMCLSSRPAAGQTGSFPWRAGEGAPQLGGIALGDPRRRIDALLGPPQRVEVMPGGAESLIYPARGLTIVLAPNDGVSIIQATSREVGDIGGVRVGDTRESVIKRWGAPRTGQGPVGLYVAGIWAVAIRVDPKRGIVEQVGVGRVAGSK